MCFSHSPSQTHRISSATAESPTSSSARRVAQAATGEPTNAAAYPANGVNGASRSPLDPLQPRMATLVCQATGAQHFVPDPLRVAERLRCILREMGVEGVVE